MMVFFLSAVYLCKRTMQNKARLELADYEAVSTTDAHTVVENEKKSGLWPCLCTLFLLALMNHKDQAALDLTAQWFSKPLFVCLLSLYTLKRVEF